jgi:hypothetical protein
MSSRATRLAEPSLTPVRMPSLIPIRMPIRPGSTLLRVLQRRGGPCSVRSAVGPIYLAQPVDTSPRLTRPYLQERSLHPSGNREPRTGRDVTVVAPGSLGQQGAAGLETGHARGDHNPAGREGVLEVCTISTRTSADPEVSLLVQEEDQTREGGAMEAVRFRVSTTLKPLPQS